MEPSIYKAPGPFVLETGHTLPELRIAYHTYGKPNAAYDNVVWVCHALTANSDVADWWPHTVEAGCFLDPARHFVVCANILGSHYGTTGPLHVNPETGSPYYKDFPPFTIRDIVRAHRLLAGALGIGRIDTLVGSSVGGFQAIEWAVMEPERIGKLMQKYAIPCIISLLVGALYNIVDQIFIANASYLGSYGNAANTVVFPLTVVALAIAVMIGDGCCAFVSISLGQNEVPKAKRSVGNAVVMCLVSSIVLAALYLIFADTILAMFGGTVNAETYHHSQEYFFYITLGVPFYMFGQAMNPIIRADGNPRFAMISTLAGAALNIILDPIFIFGFRWGMMGAAVATVIGQLVTAALAVWYLLHMKIIRPEKGDYRLKGSICGRTLTLGMTSFLSQISLVAAMAAINNMIRKYGALDAVFGQEQYAQIPMAVVGIVMKFFQIVISIVVGMAAGCIPVVGFNMGAKKPTRVKELFTKLLLAEAAVGAVALVLVELLPRQLIALFGSANESVYYTDFAVKSFRIYLCMIILACVNKACFIFLQAMGKAAESTALSMVREVVFGVGFALLLPRFFGLDGVLYSMPMSDILTFLIAGYLICKTYRELNQKGEV